jgi:hypothetical protein
MADALRITTFTLTRHDALAYEQSAGRASPLGVLALVLWLGAWGVGALLLPAEWTGPRLGWASSVLVGIALALGYVLALTLTALLQWLRAGARVPRPVEMTLAEWPDRLDVTRAGTLPETLPLRAIRESRLTRTHLLLTTDDGVVIVPRRAFVDPDALEELAARIAGRPPEETQSARGPAAAPLPKRPTRPLPPPVDGGGASA